MLPTMNSVVSGKNKKLAKEDLASEITCPLIWIKQISLKHGPEDADPLSSLLHKDQGKFESTLSYFIQQLLMHMEKLPFGEVTFLFYRMFKNFTFLGIELCFLFFQNHFYV